jgi:hypothetical protein
MQNKSAKQRLIDAVTEREKLLNSVSITQFQARKYQELSDSYHDTAHRIHAAIDRQTDLIHAAWFEFLLQTPCYKMARWLNLIKKL